ncbi:MAG: alanine racemase [Akkermansiaceae bacterium]|nr:alanine racemase [Armatimonadota bacterium]
MAIPLPVTGNDPASLRAKRYDPRMVRTWADIDLGVLAGNVRTIGAAFAPDDALDYIMAIVKADAYGHGAVAVSRVCAASGIVHFGVATVDEALTLRKAGVRGEIYLLSAFVPDEAEAILRGDIAPLLSSPEHFHALADAAKDAPLPARAFLVVDTGMGREGMLPGAARALWNEARSYPHIRLTGITSHLASADESESDGIDATRAQSASFVAFVQSVAPTFGNADDGRGNRGIWLSLCNSPGTIRRDEWLPIPSDLPGVRGVLHRAGLSLYGIEPHANAFATLPEIRQALSWRARITLVRDLPEGATIGYGRTHTLSRPSRIATVAVGYADGFPRRLSNRGTVLLHGQSLPIVGRVSMDQLQVDITDALVSVAVGETVTLLGTDGEAAIATLSFADSIGATAHEPTCYLTSRVPRLYTSIPTRGFEPPVKAFG